MLKAKITVRDHHAKRYKKYVHSAFEGRLEVFGQLLEAMMKGHCATPSPKPFRVYSPGGGGPYAHTWALFDAITHKTESFGNFSRTSIGVPKGPKARVRSTKGRQKWRNVPVWVVAVNVELGTGGYLGKSPHLAGHIRKQPPRPFMRMTMNFAARHIKKMLLRPL
ncbi:MAG: hypothetical protein ABIH23_05955 [bacterium]